VANGLDHEESDVDLLFDKKLSLQFGAWLLPSQALCWS